MHGYIVVYMRVEHVSKCLVLVNCSSSMILLGIGMGQRIVVFVHCHILIVSKFKDACFWSIDDEEVVPKVHGNFNINIFVTSLFVNVWKFSSKVCIWSCLIRYF